MSTKPNSNTVVRKPRTTATATAPNGITLKGEEEKVAQVLETVKPAQSNEPTLIDGFEGHLDNSCIVFSSEAEAKFFFKVLKEAAEKAGKAIDWTTWRIIASHNVKRSNSFRSLYGSDTTAVFIALRALQFWQIDSQGRLYKSFVDG